MILYKFIRRPLLVRGTRLWNSGLVCCNRSVVCGLFGLTGLWSMVCGLFDLRSVLWSIEAQKGRRSPSTFPWLEILGDPGNLQFLTLFFTSFFNHFGVPFGPAFCLRIWKTRVPKQHEESSRKWFEKNAIWECSKPRKLGPRAGESTILGF